MDQMPLFDISAHLTSVDPGMVRLRRISVGQSVDLQRLMSRATWRPAPGRKLAFVVEHGPALIGLLFLASPVINLSVRDEYLELPDDPTERGAELAHYADLSVCVAAQPFGWYWNGGKLCAMLAATLQSEYATAYADDLRGIVTTSLWGRGSQYNRVYKFLGYTKGFGHEHVDERTYARMVHWLRRNNVPVPSARFGEGSNVRMRRIQAYRRASGDSTATVFHGQRRGVYYTPVSSLSIAETVKNWRERWGQPRWERKQGEMPPYVSGKQMTRLKEQARKDRV